MRVTLRRRKGRGELGFTLSPTNLRIRLRRPWAPLALAEAIVQLHERFERGSLDQAT
jgi:hypothetical protein